MTDSTPTTPTGGEPTGEGVLWRALGPIPPTAGQLVADLRSREHRRPVNPKGNYRTRDVTLFEDAADCIERLVTRVAELEGMLAVARPLLDKAVEYARDSKKSAGSNLWSYVLRAARDYAAQLDKEAGGK